MSAQFQAATGLCSSDQPKEAVLPNVAENMPATVYSSFAEFYFIKKLTEKLGRRCMQRCMYYTNKTGKNKPGQLIWIDGIPDIVLKGFHPFQAHDYQGEISSLRTAAASLLEEITFMGMLPIQMRNVWNTQGLVRPVIILMIPVFEYLISTLNTNEYRPLLTKGQNATEDKTLVQLSFKFSNEMKYWCRVYWQNASVVMRVPQSAFHSQVKWRKVGMSDVDFETMWNMVGCTVDSVVDSATVVQQPTLAVPHMIRVDVQKPIAPSIDKVDWIRKSHLRSLVDQMSRKLMMPIQKREEGGFTRYFLRGFPICICSATGANVNGKDAEVIASDQMARQISRMGIFPETLLNLIQNEVKWIEPILDATRPAFQYLVELLTSDRYKILYDEGLPRVQQVDLVDSLSSDLIDWCSKMWQIRLIIYDSWAVQVPQDLWDSRQFNFTTVKGAEDNGVFGKMGSELAQIGGLPYSINGVHFYLRHWDPLYKEGWIVPNKLAIALGATDQYALVNAASQSVISSQGDSQGYQTSAEEDSMIKIIRARTSAPLKTLVESIAKELKQTITTTSFKEPNGTVRVLIKFSDIPNAFIGGTDISTEKEVAELLSYVALTNRLAQLSIIPKEILDQLIADKTWLPSIVIAVVPVFNFVTYLLNTSHYSSLVAFLRLQSSFSTINQPEQLSLLHQFEASIVKFCTDYWKGAKMQLPFGHKGNGTQFKCGACAVSSPVPIDQSDSGRDDGKMREREKERESRKEEERRKRRRHDEKRKEEEDRQREKERTKRREEEMKKEEEYKKQRQKESTVVPQSIDTSSLIAQFLQPSISSSLPIQTSFNTSDASLTIPNRSQMDLVSSLQHLQQQQDNLLLQYAMRGQTFPTDLMQQSCVFGGIGINGIPQSDAFVVGSVGGLTKEEEELLSIQKKAIEDMMREKEKGGESSRREKKRERSKEREHRSRDRSRERRHRSRDREHDGGRKRSSKDEKEREERRRERSIERRKEDRERRRREDEKRYQEKRENADREDRERGRR